MTGHGLLSVPGHRHCRSFSSFFGPFSVPPMVPAFTLQKALRLRNVPFFLSLLPRSRLAGPCFRSVGWFSSWLEWWLPLVEASGRVSRSELYLLRPVDPPRFKSLGCRATWFPWLLVSRAIASVLFRLRAATAATPAHHTLRHLCFSSGKLRLRGC